MSIKKNVLFLFVAFNSFGVFCMNQQNKENILNKLADDIKAGNDKKVLNILEKSKSLKITNEFLQKTNSLSLQINKKHFIAFSSCRDKTYYELMKRFDKKVLHNNFCLGLLIKSDRDNLVYYYLDNYIKFIDKKEKNAFEFICNFPDFLFERNNNDLAINIVKKLLSFNFLVKEWRYNTLWIDFLSDHQDFGTLIKLIRKKTNCFDTDLIRYVFDDEKDEKRRSNCSDFLPSKNYFALAKETVDKVAPDMVFNHCKKGVSFKEFFYKVLLKKEQSTLFCKESVFCYENIVNVKDDTRLRGLIRSLAYKSYNEVNKDCKRDNFSSLHDIVVQTKL